MKIEIIRLVDGLNWGVRANSTGWLEIFHLSGKKDGVASTKMGKIKME